MRKLLILLLIALVSCQTTARYEKEYEESKREHLAMLMYPGCPGEPPKKTVEDYLNTSYGDRCGLISFSVYKERPIFDKDCSSKRIAKNKCFNNFIEMLMAKWQLRYPNADWDYATTWCKSEPKNCNFMYVFGASNYELQLMRSQNKAVLENGKAELEYIQSKEDTYQLSKRKALLEAMKPAPKINCDSTKVGNIIQTECR